MTTWWTRLGAALLGACALWACSGGQTGQPGTELSCGLPLLAVGADEHLVGVSPRELARASVGRYTAPLVWLGGVDHTEQVGPEDEITIVIAYPGGDGSTNQCSSSLSVKVMVEVSTRDSGLHESGTVSLEATAGALEPANFFLNGNQLNAAVQLRVAAGQVLIVGDLQVLGDAAPSDSAHFAGQELAASGAGGNP